jgi:hypothetical protein
VQVLKLESLEDRRLLNAPGSTSSLFPQVVAPRAQAADTSPLLGLSTSGNGAATAPGIFIAPSASHGAHPGASVLLAALASARNGETVAAPSLLAALNAAYSGRTATAALAQTFGTTTLAAKYNAINAAAPLATGADGSTPENITTGPGSNSGTNAPMYAPNGASFAIGLDHGPGDHLVAPTDHALAPGSGPAFGTTATPLRDLATKFGWNPQAPESSDGGGAVAFVHPVRALFELFTYISYANGATGQYALPNPNSDAFSPPNEGGVRALFQDFATKVFESSVVSTGGLSFDMAPERDPALLPFLVEGRPASIGPEFTASPHDSPLTGAVASPADAKAPVGAASAGVAAARASALTGMGAGLILGQGRGLIVVSDVQMSAPTGRGNGILEGWTGHSVPVLPGAPAGPSRRHRNRELDRMSRERTEGVWEIAALQGSDLITHFLPFDRASLETAMEQFLDEVEGLGDSISALDETVNLLPAAVAVTLALSTAGVAIRLRRDEESASDPAAAAFPGLPGGWNLGEL